MFLHTIASRVTNTDLFASQKQQNRGMIVRSEEFYVIDCFFHKKRK